MKSKKVCSKCKEEKPFEKFGKGKSKYELKSRCKDCRREEKKEYRKNNKEKITKANKKYYEENKEIITKKRKNYYETNKEKIMRKKRRKYQTDAIFRLRDLLRGRIYKAIRGLTKQGSAVKYLGCSIEFLKDYIEKQFRPGMTWENHGEVWHLDHIIPLAAFNLTDKFQFQAACYYENLQPLFAEENMRKNGRYRQKDLENYLEYFKSKILILENDA